MSFVRHCNKPIVHPDWVEDAFNSLAKTMDLRRRNLMPKSIERPMILVPARRLLLGVYGSHWAAVIGLFREAIGSSMFDWDMRIRRFWRYRILMRSPDKDRNEFLATLAEDSIDEDEESE